MQAPAISAALTAQQKQELVRAKDRSRAIRRAAGVANFNGWATGIIALLSAPFAFFSITGFLVAVGLMVVAYNEFRGRRRLVEYDPTAAPFLGWNQIGLMTLVTGYCGWTMFTSAGAFAVEIQAKPELAAAIGSLEEFEPLYRQIVFIFYGTVIALTVAFQGLNAAYYFTRRKPIAAYVRETPAWVLEIQRLSGAN
jgi:hypothetical protein